MPKASKKTYYPPKTFDDDLAGFVKLAKDSGWSFSNVDFKLMAKDVGEQRTEREAHDAAETAFNHVHETFGLRQQDRHMRFSSAIDTARAAYKNDKAVMAQLDKFKRSVKRAAKADKVETPPK